LPRNGTANINDVQGEVGKVLFAWGCVFAACDMTAFLTDRGTNLGLVWKGAIERLRSLKRSFVNATRFDNVRKDAHPCDEWPYSPLEGRHVKVGPTRPDGKPHPHAGKTGWIMRYINIYSDPYWLGPPSAMIELDKPMLGFIWVSLESLEVLPEIVLIAEPSRWVRLAYSGLSPKSSPTANQDE